MQIQNNAWVFQNDATIIGDGKVLYPNYNDQITLFVKGTSTSRTIHFEGSDNDGNFYAIPAVKLPELTIASSTTGNDQVWVINSSPWVSIRCRISAIDGGTVNIIGKVVNSGINLMSSASVALQTSDILIGAVELKNKSTDDRLTINTDGSVNTQNTGIAVTDGSTVFESYEKDPQGYGVKRVAIAAFPSLTFTHTVVEVESTSTSVLPINLNRKYLLIVNISDTDMDLSFGVDAVANQGIPVGSNKGNYELNPWIISTQAINAIHSSVGVTKTILITEGV